MDGQTDSERQTDRHTGRRTNRHRQTANKLMDWQTDRPDRDRQTIEQPD